jgi:hypothetical protein
MGVGMDAEASLRIGFILVKEIQEYFGFGL